LEQTLSFINSEFYEAEKVKPGLENTEEFVSIQKKIKEFSENNLFGCEFPLGHLSGVEEGNKKIPVGNSSGKDGSVDVILSNPQLRWRD
jgi:type I restriction enzyme M protein